MFWLGLFIGLVVGGVVGIFLMALCVMAARNDEPRP
jgi:uncharacterized membrane-anchored protein YhcB (DUF1043 family)